MSNLAPLSQGRRSAPARRVSSLRCGSRRVLELHWHFHPTTPVGSKRAAASLAAFLVAQGRTPQAQDPFGDSGCSATQGAQLGTHEVAVPSLAAYNICPNRFRSPSASSRSYMPSRRNLYASLANSRSPACMITQHSDIHLPRLTDSMGLTKDCSVTGFLVNPTARPMSLWPAAGPSS